MIEYFKHDASGIVIYQTEGIFQLPISTIRYVKRLCEQALFTYEGYIKACKQHINRSYKLPVVIHEEMMLLPTGGIRNYETIWINYPAIWAMHDIEDGLQLIFISGRELTLSINTTLWMEQIKDLLVIRNTKVKHFHAQSYRKCLQ